MGWRGVGGVLAVLAIGAWGQQLAPVFLQEPPSLLRFSNGTGARASCAALGSPPPALVWQTADGGPVDNVPGLRQVLENGTLVLLPFPAEQYRAEVHSGTLRCRAANLHGAAVSRDVRVQAVVWQEWEPQVRWSRSEAGAPALLTCGVPAAMRDHTAVSAWHRGDSVLQPGDDYSGNILLLDGGWSLVIRSTSTELAATRYSCSVLDTLTGERRRSAPAQIEVTPASRSESAPRPVSPSPWEVWVSSGEVALLPCLVAAQPPAAVTWYRESASGIPREVRVGEAGSRYADVGGALVVRRAAAADGGRWTCRAANARGHVTLRGVLNVLEPLSVLLQPQLQVVNSGGTASFNCSWGGWPSGRVEWLHNASPLGAGGGGGGRARVSGGGARLEVRGVRRGDAGVYQCLVRSERDSAQAAAELRLGDTAPELQYTFIEQVLRAGQVVTLKCSALGTPPPHFTWLLDGNPLSAVARPHRYSVEQFTSKSGEVVGYLNITSVRSEDGGLYTCRAANSLGEVSHTSRLNIYGPPYVRSVGPIRAVAGRELVLHCPYSGYPISSVKWERDGSPIPWSGSDGSLRLSRVEAAHGGVYACVAASPQGDTARRDLTLIVTNPPEIEPFSFSAQLAEGKRAQVSCSVTSGDMPVHFTWLKDDRPIPSSLQVEERGADFFSNLVFKEVTSHHSGFYTCIASNSAAKVNYTAELVVKVAPKWVTEPHDTSTLAGEPLALHCQATGSPQPQITWLKQRGGTASDFVPILSMGDRVQVLNNGSLLLESALSYDEGHYQCRVENGVPPALSTTVFVAVNEPARFEVTSTNATARRGAAATLGCEARGDHPLRLVWSHNGNTIDAHSYRLSISEAKTDVGLRSQLYISRADRQDSGVYKCHAVNAYGHSDHYIYLSVQEKPEAPHSLSVTGIESRAVRLAWAAGFDGNAPLLGFTVEWAPLDTAAGAAPRWRDAAQHNVSLPQHDVSHTQHDVSLAEHNHRTHSPLLLWKKGVGHYEALVGALSPAAAYMLRVAALNQIARSDYTEPVVVKTREEAPSAAPVSVSVSAPAPGSLSVSWRAPPPHTHNGQLLGYTVTCTPLPPAPGNTTRSVTVEGSSSTSAVVTGLRQFRRYVVSVRAFNAVAAGPASPNVEATTLEGVPEAAPMHVSCTALSSTSLRLWWEPPPPHTHAGLIQGYKVIYAPIADYHEPAEVKRVTATETYLHALHKYTNYSVQLLAYTGAGDGARSQAIYCLTDEDVPSPPQKIKALPLSNDAIIVSWEPPLLPNGHLTHYTVYYREAGRGGGGVGSGGQWSLRVGAEVGAVSQWARVGGLRAAPLQLHVTAATARGESAPTSLVPVTPTDGNMPARIASFGGAVSLPRGAAARLPCAAAGAPAPRVRWVRGAGGGAGGGGAAPPHSQYTITPQGDLLIHELSVETGGNWTCTAWNHVGEESITYAVQVVAPPPPPALSLQYATPTALTLHWTNNGDGGAPILAYVLEWRGLWADADVTWSTVELPASATSHTLSALRCGCTYALRLRARNKVAAGPPSAELRANTRGSPPKPPKPEELIFSNSTALKINLYAWRDGGCPILGFTIAYRKADTEHWIQMEGGSVVSAASVVVGGLEAGAWYEVCVEARSDAGLQRALLLHDTHTHNGSRAARPARGAGGAGGWAWGAGLALATTAALAALAGYCTYRLWCVSRATYSHDGRKLSESGDAEREKLREGHKMYSASDIHHDKSNDDSSAELYEISPYATFGPLSAELSLQYRSLARDSDAAPPQLQLQQQQQQHRKQRRRRCNRHRYDESSLSASSTVEVCHRARAARAGGGGGGAGAAGGGGGGGWHDVAPDSDDNSDSLRDTGPGSLGSSTGGGDGSRRGVSSGSTECEGLLPGSYTPVPTTDISTLIDKYQQRKEQERRECTIHV